jgi:branched-chain amino acid transport system substrate-binding protein
MYSISVFISTFFISLLLFPIPGSEQTDPPIRIGATMSQSGAYSTQGIAAKNGYLLCEQDTNSEGGVLNRKIEFVIHDDQSNSQVAIDLYEKLITEEGVDAIMGPYGSTLTEAVAPVTERHRMVHISPLAATSSIWEQGRQYLFMILPPAELFLAGLIEMAYENDLRSVAIIQENQLFPKAAGSGAADLAREKGMEVNIVYTYNSGRTDFSGFLKTVKYAEIDVLAMAASSLDDFITITKQMKELDVNVKMFGTSGAVTPYQEALGEDAEYTYGLSAWEPGLPNPGIDQFVESYRNRFQIEPSFHAAGAYASCQIFMEVIRRTESLDSDLLREELLAMEIQTILSNYAVDERGYQIANSGLFIQWQDGEKVIVWPAELAQENPRFPTPNWDQR